MEIANLYKLMTVGTSIRKLFDEVSGRREQWETYWLQDLRQYKGIYDPEVQAKFGPKQSKAFIRETRTKVRTLDARIMDLLFPANGEKNWGLEPGAMPDLAAPFEKILIDAITIALQASGQNRPPTKEEFNVAKRTFAAEKCRLMSREIEDQLSEIRYRAIIRDVAHSGHLFGTGWLKGPLVNQLVEPHWELQSDDKGSFSWRLVEKQVNKPYAEFRSIWNCFPDMSVTDLQSARFMCERHVLPRHSLFQLANRKDFNGVYIKEYIKNNPSGKANYTSYESLLYNLKDAYSVQRTLLPLQGMYEAVEYWGFLAGESLVELDAEKYIDINPVDDFAVNIWLLDNVPIKLALQPINGLVIPYYAYYFDKDETCIFGEGIGQIMRDPQRLVNASVRALVDNAAHCAGPQYEVNVDLLAEGEDPTDIGAFKVWMRTGKDADVAGKEVVRVKQIASYTPEFLNMYGLFSRLGDEVTIIPRYLQGDARVSGAGRTASGLSMLMGQANVGLSDLVKMFDEGVTKPFITSMYNWNMQFNENEDIKGDMKAVARGSTALMAKEIRAQQIQTFLQMTLNPADASWVKRGNLLRQWAEATDIFADQAVYTEDEHTEIVDQQQAQAAQVQQQSQGAGFNQLESVIKQLEEGMQMIAEKVSGLEAFLAQSVNKANRAKMINSPGAEAA